MERYTWVAFYKELAEKLRTYRYNRQALVDKVRQIYERTDKVNMPRLENGEFVDFEPFSFYSLFNRGLTEDKRILLTSIIADLFELKTTPPSDFAGIPIVNSQKALFYAFSGDRTDDDIDILWTLFEHALDYSDDKNETNRNNVKEYFDKALSVKNVGYAKMTMGLFWIAPESFLALDSRNKDYIYNSGEIPENVISRMPSLDSLNKDSSANTYLKIVDEIARCVDTGQYESFVDFSYRAYTYSKRMDEEKRKQATAMDGIEEGGTKETHYWIYAPGRNAEKWEEFYNEGVMAIGWSGIGDITRYSNMEEVAEAVRSTYNKTGTVKNIRLALWEFTHKLKPGDVVFVKRGQHEIVGRGIVESDYYYDSETADEYRNRRKVNWTHKGSWVHDTQAVMKTLTDITDYTDYVEWLNGLFDMEMDEDPLEESQLEEPDDYTVNDFLKKVYMSLDQYEELSGLLESEKNVILQGAPGVGKTFAAKRLAYAMMGKRDSRRVGLIQFHQSYSYEDFIEGFRPVRGNNGFDIEKGVFYKFCKGAEDYPDDKFFFIIDEINRGNLSKIFGELFMLIEKDKRNTPVQLLYSGEKFRVPENVYIIGMMNTADRSLAMMDYALRRRFAFYELEPAFQSDGFKAYQKELSSDKFNRLVRIIEEINDEILQDNSLGRGFRIGHSYLCNLEHVDDSKLRSIVKFQILPLLSEYYFDNEDAYRLAEQRLEEFTR